MHVLLCGATRGELIPDLKAFRPERAPLSILERYRHQSAPDFILDILITGVGQISTAISLTRAFDKIPYQFAINAGVAGSFTESLKSGDVVLVKRDCFSDLGAEDGPEFISLQELGLPHFRDDLFKGIWLEPEIPSLLVLSDIRQATGITVSTVHGDENSILKIRQRINPDTESMEGAAFFLTAMDAEIPCIQLRGISNRVERRNRENWNLPDAIMKVNKKTDLVLHELTRNKR